MSILTLQRRHATVWRLRLGEKGPKGEPRRLTESMRVTAPSQQIVEAFADTYAGEVRPWEKQWEVYLPRTELPVILLPGESLQQWFERWKGAVCVRRCDGVTQQTDEPCACRINDAGMPEGPEACVITTRLSIVAPEVPVLGAGTLVTHGEVAGRQLPSAVAIAEAALARGSVVPATLRVTEHRAAGRRYVVPTLEVVGVSFHQLQSGHVPQAIGSAPPPAIDRPSSPALGPAPERPDEGQGESAAPPASPNPHAATIDSLMSRLTNRERALVRGAWKDRRIRSTTDPEFGPADVEAVSELVMPYLERAEETNG